MRSVRSRITIIAALATALAVSVAGVLLLAQLERSLRAELDESLERQILNFEFEVFEFADLEAAPLPVDFETLFAVIDRQGDFLMANDIDADGAEIASQLPLNDSFELEVAFEDISLQSPSETSGAGDMRAAYYELFLEDVADDNQYFVVIARSNEPTDRTVARSRNAVLAGIPLLVAFVAALAWWLTGRALRPVDHMRTEVDEISSSDLARRISEPGTRDEVGQLATTMNAMLARLQSSQESQDRFVSDAAHELRTPLASIAAQIDVDVAHPDSADHSATARNVRAEVQRLQSLIEGLLASARGQEGSVVRVGKLVDLDVVVTEALGRVPTPHHLRVDHQSVGIGTVRGDEAALASLLDNLLTNAYRHARSIVAVGVGTDTNGVWLTVDDDGAGISEANRDRVFDRFVRLDESRTKDAGGSGLGLALARDTARHHRGQLWVEESPLGGARFALRLPDASAAGC